MNSFLIRFDTLSKAEDDETTACAAFAFDPPLKAERGKGEIRLMITILLKGNKPIEQENLTGLGNALALRFYNSSGPITSGLKGIIDHFNTALFEDNMATTARGSFQNGHIVVFALREEVLYIVQSGLSKVHHITQLSREFYNLELAGKGAGLTSTARMYFAQAQVDPNDKFIVVFEAEESVEKGVESLRQVSSVEMIQKRLLSLANEPVHGSVFDFQRAEASAFVRVDQRDVAPTTVKTVLPQEKSFPVGPIETGARASKLDDLETQEDLEDRYEKPRQDQPRPPKRLAKNRSSNGTLPDLLLSGLLGVKEGISFARRSLNWLVAHLAPTGEEGNHNQRVYRNFSIGMALLIPVFLFVYAGYYYGNFGYLARYNAHLNNASDELTLAANEADPATRKRHYQIAIEEIEKAKSGVPKLDERGATLLADALGPLDELEKVIRLSFAPVLSQRLPADHKISQLVVTDTEIYILDETDNKVIREVFNGNRFDRDNNFVCGSNAVVTDGDPGDLLTILALPRAGSANTIAALDHNANLVYCGPGKSQEVEPLPLPAAGIKSVTSAAIQGSTMILLDAVGRAIWTYQADEDMKFTSDPMFYLGNNIPENFSTSTDLVFNQDNVYILAEGGALTVCGSDGTTDCESPYQFVDTRPGMSSGTQLEDGTFGQSEVTFLPTASVLFLDKERKAIFRFSAISMELQNKYLADPSVIDEILATYPFKAFAVNAANQLFVLVDDQIYSAKLFK